jgi:hypothetical protein
MYRSIEMKTPALARFLRRKWLETRAVAGVSNFVEWRAMNVR